MLPLALVQIIQVPLHGSIKFRHERPRLAVSAAQQKRREPVWDGFEKAYSALFAPGGKVALPARVALGCRIIQLHYAASDREVVALVQESPYLQYFLGFESFTDAVPFSSRTVARFRARIPDKAVRPAVRLLRSFQ